MEQRISNTSECLCVEFLLVLCEHFTSVIVVKVPNFVWKNAFNAPLNARILHRIFFIRSTHFQTPSLSSLLFLRFIGLLQLHVYIACPPKPVFMGIQATTPFMSSSSPYLNDSRIPFSDASWHSFLFLL